VAAVYVIVVYAAIVLITQLTGGWAPANLITPGLGLAGAVTVICCISVLGSTLLGSSANGIGVFMVFGAGLTAGLLGQIGHALDNDTLKQIGEVISIAFPFEALYQGGLHGLTSGGDGALANTVVNLGPFGGAKALSALAILWAVVYVGGLVFGALRSFSRLDL
jgi:Cu-processing system permease protein